MAGNGTMLVKKGWRAHKYYLSDEAVELLEAHCRELHIPMSSYLDMLLKQNLAAATNAPTLFPPRPDEYSKPSRIPPAPDLGSDGDYDPFQKQPTKKDPDFDF